MALLISCEVLSDCQGISNKLGFGWSRVKTNKLEFQWLRLTLPMEGAWVPSQVRGAKILSDCTAGCENKKKLQVNLKI